jgi:hypothetical protein
LAQLNQQVVACCCIGLGDALLSGWVSWTGSLKMLNDFRQLLEGYCSHGSP